MSRIATVSGRALPLRGDDVDTDRIIPARYLKSITFDGLEQHLFADDRAASTRHPVNDPRYAGASVLVVGRNFGCGSSREHAPQAIYRRGIRAVVGESFSEIFFGNSVAIGLPCARVSRDEAVSLMVEVERDPSLTVTVDLENAVVRAGTRVIAATIPPSARQAFLTGEWDGTGLLLANGDAIDRVAASLPYITAFT